MKVASNTAKLLKNVPMPDEIGQVITNAAIIDIGSYLTRVGFAGDNYPRLLERTHCVASVDSNDLHVKICHDSNNDNNNNSSIKNINNINNNNSNENNVTEDESKTYSCIHNGNITDWNQYESILDRLDDMLCFSKRSANSLLPQSLHSHTSLSCSSAMHEMPLLFTEKALVTHEQRERVAQILFETFDVPKIQFSLSPSLSLYAAGLSTGVGLEMGHEQCHVVPVFQGISWFHATHTFPYGGSHLTQLFKYNATHTDNNNNYNNTETFDSRNNNNNNNSSNNSCYVHKEHLSTIPISWTELKERYCCVASSHELYCSTLEEENINLHNMSTLTHTLPDGNTVLLSNVCTMSAEAFFVPQLFSSINGANSENSTRNFKEVKSVVELPTSLNPNAGLHELLVDSIQKCDADIIPELYENIVLSGGTSLTRDFSLRLRREVQLLLSSSTSFPSSAANLQPETESFASSTLQHINSNVAETVNIHALPERQHASFVGASILASLPTFDAMWITKSKYDEHGSKAIQFKCLNERNRECH